MLDPLVLVLDAEAELDEAAAAAFAESGVLLVIM
jgi:hypothetical protein